MSVTVEELKIEAEGIQNYLDVTCSNNPEEITERIVQLMAHLSRSGEMLAQAKRLLRKRKSEEVQNVIIKIAKENCLSATVQNTLLESIADNEAYAVDLIERINRTCTHQLDALRSLLSYERENLRMTKSGY
jgi:uncharacterized protein YoaH (UPF0181 family)